MPEEPDQLSVLLRGDPFFYVIEYIIPMKFRLFLIALVIRYAFKKVVVITLVE